MNEYRVIIETLKGYYEYVVEADTDQAAIDEALSLAYADGLARYNPIYTRTEVLS